MKRKIEVQYRLPVGEGGLTISCEVTVYEQHWLPRLLRVGGLVVRKRLVYLRRGGRRGIAGERLAPADLVAHELVHVVQRDVWGFWGYWRRILWDILRYPTRKRSRPTEFAAYAAERPLAIRGSAQLLHPVCRIDTLVLLTDIYPPLPHPVE